jgi:hypothetical protein
MPSVITPIIDTAIGVVVVYIAFSLLASWLGEQLSSFLKTRSKMLVGAITQLLSGTPGAAGLAANKTSDTVKDPAAAAFFAHPIFRALKESPTKDPQYLSAQQFSSVLLGLVNPEGPPAPVTPQTEAAPASPPPFDFTNTIEAAKKVGLTLAPGAAVPDTPLAQQISALAAKANGNYTAFVKAIEDWYDDHMDRVSGWYVKHTQIVLVIIGFIVASLWNVDTLRVVRAFSCNTALRTTTAQIKTGTKEAPDAALIKTVIDAVPLGWDFSSKDDAPPEHSLSCDVVAAASSPSAPTTSNAALVAAAEQAEDDKTAADRVATATSNRYDNAARSAKPGPTNRVARERAATAKRERDAARSTANKAAAAKTAADKAVSDAAPAPRQWSDWWLWWALKIIGLVLTAVALAQGANFWFDTLSSLTRVRNAGKKPDTSPDASRA